MRYFIDLTTVLTQKELKVRYKHSFLGYLWSIAHPLACAFVFFMAFKVIMRVQMEGYVLFLIAGLFPWQWFSNSVNMSPNIFLSNSSIIKKVNFQRSAIVLASVLNETIHFAVSIPVIAFFVFVYHRTAHFSWLYGIPLLLIIQLVFTYGISLAISSLNIFFRDLERIAGICVALLFYFTPVIYNESMVPEKYRGLINFNPMSPLMVSWRDLFLDGRLDPPLLLISSIYAALALLAGFLIYRKLVWKFAEVL
ncbi:MAG: ABC transporter permease [Elusimicrobiales bacterium]|jgi:lipopolysaccharide transport system permease protein